ncbi:uridine nucleosidase [Monosporozyma servazzii]
MTISTIPIWLDCDPGHDDAIAILISCFHPAFKLLGISTCFGNSSPENTDYNARSLLTAMNKINTVPIYHGAQNPWRRKELNYAPDIHGETGLDGTTLLPTPAREANDDMTYLDAMEQEILLHEGEITLISTGALTSIATLLKFKPELIDKIKFISIMGGSFNGLGNKNPNQSAEFNIWIDPHAAHYILTNPIFSSKCILCPLNLTHKAIATKEIIENKIYPMQLRKQNLRTLYYELFLFFKKTYKDNQGFINGPPIHDPMTLYPLLQFYNYESSDIINFKYMKMDVDIITDLKDDDAGMIFALKEYNDPPMNATESEGLFDENLTSRPGVIVGYDININYFWDQISECLALAQESSTIED